MVLRPGVFQPICDFYHIAVKTTRLEILRELHPSSNPHLVSRAVPYTIEVLKPDSDPRRPNARFLERTSDATFSFLEL